MDSLPTRGESEISVIIDPEEPYKNEIASYAYEYSQKDKDFVLLLNAENGAWTHDRLHPVKYERDGKWWSDYGLCGISAYYHTEKFLEAKEGDWKKGVELCYDLYKQGTTFYGWFVRTERGKNIKFLK